MIYYSEYHILLWFIAQFTMVYYSKYYILLWFTTVNTIFTMVYYGL